MEEGRRKFLKLGSRAAGTALVSSLMAFIAVSAQSEEDGGNNRVLIDRNKEALFGNAQFLMENYGMNDPDKAEKLYKRVLWETGLYGFGGGVFGPVFCMVSNGTNIPFIGKGGFVRGIFNVLISESSAVGVAGAAHDVFLNEDETFLLNPDNIVREYGMTQENAERFCDDYKKGFSGEVGVSSLFSSVAYQSAHGLKGMAKWTIKALSKRKEEVAAAENPGVNDAEIVDVEFEKLSP